MKQGIIARAAAVIDAPIADVWNALVTPATIERYMFGATVLSDWQEGGPIVWKGEWQGRPYEDRGTLLRVDPRRILQYSHYSPLSGLPDTPENHHVVTIELTQREDGGTGVSLTQDNNPTEQARAHSERNWSTMLAALKKIVEETAPREAPPI